LPVLKEQERSVILFRRRKGGVAGAQSRQCEKCEDEG